MPASLSLFFNFRCSLSCSFRSLLTCFSASFFIFLISLSSSLRCSTKSNSMSSVLLWSRLLTCPQKSRGAQCALS